MRSGFVAVLVFVAACRVGFENVTTSSSDAAGGSDATNSLLCPGSYAFSYASSRYRIASTDNWMSAESDCESDGATSHLLVLEDAAERDALVALTQQVPGRAWLGTSDRISVGAWLVVTGGPATYLPWQPGSPTIVNALCVSWEPGAGNTREELCSANVNHICECDGHPADHGAF
jgi:hypothetical protein